MSILRSLRIGMMCFGVVMGAAFPLYAWVFVDYKPGQAVWFNVGCVLMGIAVGTFSSLLVKLILLKKLDLLLEGYQQLQRGQYGYQVDLQSDDQIGQMVEGFNTMSSALNEIMLTLRGGATDLGDVSGNIALFATSLQNTINEQNLNINALSGATSRVSETLVSVDDRLQGTAEYSSTISNHADDISNILDSAIESMQQTDESMRTTLSRFDRLHQQSEDINNIITMIHDITDQTNLLALNAAIEAARAGDQGRGFAVVADEVRKLAVKTAKSTDQIQVHIKALQEGVTGTVMTIHDHYDQLGSLRKTLGESSRSVEEIIRSIGSSADMVHTVSLAVTEQSNAVTQINEFMQNVGGAFDALRGTSRGLVQESSRIMGITSGLRRNLRTADTV